MWETTKEILLSRHPLSGIVYLAAGAIIGAIVSVRYSIKAQRPKLIISGGGSGGNQQHHRWSVSLTNRPSFFGQNLDGEPARDIVAWLRLDEPSAQFHMLYWDGQPQGGVTIEAGQQRSLQLFQWREGAQGYTIVDGSGEPVARFQTRKLRFVLRLNDRLGRMTEFPFTVEFDDTHLKNTPRLTITHPISFSERMRRVKRGVQDIRSAFRAG